MHGHCSVITLLGLLVCLGAVSTLDINHGNRDTREGVEDIHYYLWTLSNSGDDQYYELINGDAGRLAGSPFDGAKKTYFITHGYSSNGFTSFITEGKTKILSLEDANVISIDWDKLAFSINYWSAADNVYVVGPYTATFIDFLVNSGGASTSDIELTGHSLGAHVCGLAAQAVSTGTVLRVTGLDPAGPAFYDATPSERLDASQASYVDVIHTNGGTLGGADYGLSFSIGDTDFYPNGGTRQPGCGIDVAGCSHGRSHDYWVESITAGAPYSSGDGATPEEFQSWPCADWDTFDAGSCTSCAAGCNMMGFHNNNGVYGDYFLRSGESSPYAQGSSQA